MINKLTQSDAVASGDWFVVWKDSAGDFRGVPGSVVLAWIQAGLTFPDAGRPEPETQYASPAASGFTVQVADAAAAGNVDVHLILSPLAGYAAGTIKLPVNTGLRDKQLVMVNCTQAVAALTVDGNGATELGAPAALLANAYFTMQYDLTMNTWYRVG